MNIGRREVIELAAALGVPMRAGDTVARLWWRSVERAHELKAIERALGRPPRSVEPHCSECGMQLATVVEPHGGGSWSVCVRCNPPCDHAGSEVSIDRATGEERCADCGGAARA